MEEQQPTEKLLACLFAFSGYCCLTEIGLSFGDGRGGGWSLWIAPALSVFTLCFQMLSLVAVGNKDKKNKGAMAPSALYNTALALQLSLLAILWLATGALTFINIRRYNRTRQDHEAPVKPVAWVEAAIAIITSGFIYWQSLIIAYRRRQLFERVEPRPIQLRVMRTNSQPRNSVMPSTELPTSNISYKNVDTQESF
ncbi:hypothetical protein FRC17_002435 [Serendipita sp. 399]|nr:hypothetical protein FRC17_002435 [Serendipita sp. 399]